VQGRQAIRALKLVELFNACQDEFSDTVKAKAASVSFGGTNGVAEKKSKAASCRERSAGIAMPGAFVHIFAKEITEIYRNHHLARTSAGDPRAFSLEQAYAVQEMYLATRIASGERFMGYKVGCTSSAIRAQFGLSQPICGRLLAPHLYQDGATLYPEDYVNCALEAELVFHLGSDLHGDNLETAYLRSAISAVSPGIEIHNWRFWYGAPTLQELIASNGIHAGLVIGSPQPLPPDLDLTRECTSLRVNEVEQDAGSGADLMEGRGPLESLRWLLTHLRQRDLVLRAGDLVIPGSATKLVPVVAGDVAEARFTHFGVCRATFRNRHSS
jgi:2-keto-4-pentenoate hydratase